MKAIVLLVVVFGVTVGAAPPRGDEKLPRHKSEKAERRAHRLHLMYVVSIAEALELTDSEALKLSEKLRVFEAKRQPLGAQMAESMRALKEAAAGDASAFGSVDANIKRVLDGRAQLALLDQEMFEALSQGLSAQKKAKLALTLGQLHRRLRGERDERAEKHTF